MKKKIFAISIVFVITLMVSFNLGIFALPVTDEQENISIQEEYYNVSLEDLDKYKDDENELLKVRSITVISRDKDKISEKLDLIKLCKNIKSIYLCVYDLDIDSNFFNNISTIEDISVSLQFMNVNLEGITNQKITSVSLTGCNIINFYEISNLKNIKKLNIDSCDGFETKGFDALKSLQELTVSGQRIDDYKSFFKGIKNVKELSLENSNLQNSDTIYIIELKELQKLNIYGTFVNYITFLKYLPNLEKITLPLDVESLDILYELPKLKSVGFDAVTETKVDERLIDYFNNKNIVYINDFDKNIKDKLQKILNDFNFTENTSDEEKTRKITKYVVANMKYSCDELGPYLGSLDKTINCEYGVCHDYAILEYTLLTMSGVKAFYVSGYACYIGEGSQIKNISGGHAWNVVNLDGEFYSIDATWADAGNVLNTNYYLKKLDNTNQDEKDINFNLKHLTFNNPRDTLF